MSDFLREGGLQDAIEEEKQKKAEEKKREEAEKKAEERKLAGKEDELDDRRTDHDSEEEKKIDDEPNEKMEGKMGFKKVKLEKKEGLKALSLPSISLNLNLNLNNLNLNMLSGEQQKYFTIQNGILYVYERKTAREMIDRFKISQMDAMDIKKEENNQNTIRILYKKFYLMLTVETPELCQKWFNSLKYVKDNSD